MKLDRIKRENDNIFKNVLDKRVTNLYNERSLLFLNKSSSYPERLRDQARRSRSNRFAAHALRRQVLTPAHCDGKDEKKTDTDSCSLF